MRRGSPARDRTNYHCSGGKLEAVVADAAAPTLALPFQLDDVARKRIKGHRLERGGDSILIFSGKPCELFSRRSLRSSRKAGVRRDQFLGSLKVRAPHPLRSCDN